MLKKTIYFLVLIFSVWACTSDDSSSNPDPNNNFDRSALLTNYADNIIIPSFQNLETLLNTLKSSSDTFIGTSNQTNLDALSTAWLNAYKAWQRVQMFNLGEAENIAGLSDRGFVTFFNIHPTDFSEIDNGAASGNYDFTNSTYYDSQGFPAVDYLLHGTASGDASALAKFTTNTNATGYKDYLNDAITRMQTLITQIVNDWITSYRNIFVANLSDGLNGAFNMLVNDFIFSYETDFRKFKVGTPAGNFSASPQPNTVEAIFKGDVNKTLTLEALTAIEDVFEGKAFGGSATGSSFKSYLEFLNREDLVTAITNQFSAVRTSVNGLNNSFFQQVNTDNTAMTATYDVMQVAVPLLKVDMISAFSVSIDYTDSDND